MKVSGRNILVFLFLVTGIFSFSACRQAEENAVNSAQPSPEKKTDDFQDSLRSVQTGGFDFILAFRRPDGEVLTSDDKKFLKDNSPLDTNQWALTADGKAAIAGSNYKFMPQNLAVLKKRFNIEDYSLKTDDSGNSNININGNSNQNTNTVK